MSRSSAELRRRAEARLRVRRPRPISAAGAPKSAADSQRLLHELQVHQVELELQNAELQAARDRMETLLEKYTDLYDFAPVGYLSLDAHGHILEANLTAAALLGVERSRLINRRLLLFIAPASRPVFLAFVEEVDTSAQGQACEALVLKPGGAPYWAGFRATSANGTKGAGKWCRVTFGDITARKEAEEAQRRMEVFEVSNRELRREIVQRQAVEVALKQSEQEQRRMLEQSQQMQGQLRHLSHQLLQAQEEERRRISRELHDEVTQTLVGINVHLATLAREGTVNPRQLKQRIARTQRLVEKAVDIVHQFARELRPTALDDLGLISALHSFLRDFMKRTGIQVEFAAFAGVDKLDGPKRTVLYRVIQSALTNVAQHAHASRANVSIRRSGDTVHLEIADNGKAFEVERVLDVKRYKRLGLLGMRERVEMIGGVFRVESAPGRGTTVLADIPFQGKSARGGGRRNWPKPTLKACF